MEHNIKIVTNKKKKLTGRQKFGLAFGVLVLALIAIGGYIVYKIDKNVYAITGENGALFKTAKSFLMKDEEVLKNENGRTNILLLGMRGEDDPSGGTLTDSIMLISLNEPTGKVAAISIPRDLYVPIDGQKGSQKLNRAYTEGENQDPPRGLEVAMKTVEGIVGVPIHYAVNIDFEAFREIIDSLDGITVDVSQNLYDTHYGGVNVKAGQVDMDSELALKYVQSRLSTSDFDRSRRQREVISAIQKKARETGALKNPIKVFNMLDSLGKHVRVNFSVEEIRAALALVEKVNIDEMIQKGYDTSPGGYLTSTSSPVFGYIIVPKSGNFDKIHEEVRGIFDTPIEDSSETVSDSPNESED
jgi:LCP family protein required for cell wall assembly